MILDILLPGIDGYAICRDLRAAGIEGPFVALSSSAMAGQVERGIASGFDECLTKPISPAALAAAPRRMAAPCRGGRRTRPP